MPAYIDDDLASAGVRAFISALAGAANSTRGQTAHAGGTQAAATVLANTAFNTVNTVASAADSVAMPVLASLGEFRWVANRGANAMQLFGQGTDTINGVATATGVSIPAGKSAFLWVDIAAPAGNWNMLLSA